MSRNKVPERQEKMVAAQQLTQRDAQKLLMWVIARPQRLLNIEINDLSAQLVAKAK